MKVACLLIPHLPVQVERRHDPSLAPSPLVVGGRPWDDAAVLDCCPESASAGVMPGMRLSQAEALCPSANFVPANDEAYHAIHEALISVAGRFTPTIETGVLGLLYAEVSGLERRFGPDEELARQISLAANQALRPDTEQAPEFDLRIGLASSKFTAAQAARAARPGGRSIVPPGEEQPFLSPLPLSALPADPEMLRRLHLLGIDTLGALATLPRLAVVRQFGFLAGPLHDLCRGLDPRPVDPIRPPLQLSRTRTFSDPLTERAPILAHAKQIVAELAGALSRRGYQAEGLRLQLEEESGKKHTSGSSIKPPSAEPSKLLRLAGTLLHRQSPAGPIISLSLTIYPLRPFHLGTAQMSFLSEEAEAPFDSTKPQQAESLRETLRLLRERFGDMIVVAASLLGPPPPHPVQVTTNPQGLPRAVVWRDRIREVAAIHETWREDTHWWSRPVERDYFRLETGDGQVRVVFHDLRSDRWLLERRHI
jgi:nucleotidyltransferase/DNA polymerase involved in DNA repair